MTQIIMFIGIGLAAIGVLLCGFTTRWQNGWFTEYRVTNRRIFSLGLLFVILGLGLVIAAAYANGQLN